MTFLFGDLSPAPFVTNFLEDLRDALDFAGGIAEADQMVVNAEARREALRKGAEAEHARLDALTWAMIAAATAADQGASGSATARLAAELGKLIQERRDASDASVRTKLEADLVAVDAEVRAARADYFPTLQDWLLVRVPPKAKQTWSIELIPGAKKDLHRYRAVLAGESAIGLTWTIDLALEENGIWASPLRVSRLVEDLAIVTPQVTGLIKKEIKSKKQKIDRHWITGVVDDGEAIRIELREEIGDADGFSITVGPSTIALVRTASADDPTAGAFPVAPEDERALRDLAGQVREIVRSLPKQKVASATFDGQPFDGTNVELQPRLVQVVVRLVESLAPTVEDIASRSRSDAELVLRRELDDGRREELFMPKARLREKFATLDEAHQKLFAAITIALAAEPPSSKPASAPASVSTIRNEVPQQEPGFVRRRSSGKLGAVNAPLLKEEPPAYARHKAAAAAAAAAAERPKLVISDDSEVDTVAPTSTTAPLKEALKLARTATQEGRLDEAFRAYATAFASAAFASSRPDDQRQALKLMFFGKQPEVTNGDVKNAYRVALPILQALVLKDRDPADYELVGMAYVVLDEPEKAMEIFKKALDVERARNPASDLCGNLMRRVSQL
jgi:tetratricopeptide (TPR) repeat protein